MNSEITKKIQRSGVVMNPTIHPAKKRNVPFDILIHTITYSYNDNVNVPK